MNNKVIQSGNDLIAVVGLVNSTVNITQLLGMNVDYQKLMEQLDDDKDLFSRLGEDESDKRLRISKKINDLESLIEEFKRNVLQLAETLQRIEIKSERLRQAKEFFDNGKFAEARAVFETELEQMQDEQTRLLKTREELELKLEVDILPKLKNNAEEFLILALATQTDYLNPDRFEKANEYFKESIKSFKNKDNLRNYAYFLQTHNFLGNAHAYYHEILDNYFNDLIDWEYGIILQNLGILHNQFPSGGHQAINDFEKALKFWRSINDKNPSNSMQLQIASTLSLISSWYSGIGDFEKSLQITEESLRIFCQIMELTSQDYTFDIAMRLRNLGFINKQLNNFKKSEEQLLGALLICKQFKKDRTQKKKSLISTIYGDLADLYERQNNYQKARKYYLDGLKILRELVSVNYLGYLHDLVVELYNLANHFIRENDFDEGLKYARESHDIYHKLNSVNSDAYLGEICRSHEQLGRIYTDLRDFEKASQSLEDALAEIRNLVEINPQKYSSNFGLILQNYAELKSDQGNLDDSLIYLNEALELYGNLAKSNPKIHLRWLALTLLKLGILYKDLQDFENAPKFQKKALKIYRKLALENPSVYLPDVARCLANLGIFYCDIAEDYKKSLKYLEEAYVTLQPFAKLNPQQISYEFSTITKCLGVVYGNQNQYDKSRIKYEESLEIVKSLAKNNKYYLKDVVHIHEHVVYIYEKLAKMFYGKRAFGNSIKEAEKALKIYENLARENPNKYLAKVGESHLFIGLAQQESGKSKNAIKKYRLAIENYQEAIKLTESNEYREKVADILLGAACANVTLKNYFEAIQDTEEALEVYRQLAETDLPNQMPNLVNALAKLAVFYFEGFPQNEKSVDYAVESLTYCAWILEENKTIEEHYARGCMAILKAFDFNEDEIIKMICEKKLVIDEIGND